MPEIEAIATDTLVELEQAGQKVVPTARAAKLTMNREGIRRLAAEELQLPTSRYRFADSEEGFRAAVTEIGLPCIVKPVMSSSGKGQSFIRSADQLSEAWRYAQQGGRAGAGRVIVEGVVNFDFEITLLTVSAVDGVHFCAPVGHRQEDGDYRESWQPQQMSDLALERAPGHRPRGGAGAGRLWSVWRGAVRMRRRGDLQRSLPATTRHRDGDAYLPGSLGIRPARRAFLGLPVGAIRQYGPAASAVILPQLSSQNVSFGQLQSAVGAGLQLRLFGKPEIDGTRRLGVTLAVADSVEEAVARAKAAAAAVNRRRVKTKNPVALPQTGLLTWRRGLFRAFHRFSREGGDAIVVAGFEGVGWHQPGTADAQYAVQRQVVTVVGRRDTAGRAETNVAERTAIACRASAAARVASDGRFKLFQAILHTQHQLRYRADPRDQRDGAVFGRRFQQGFGKTRADSELRAGFRYRFQLLNVGNRARADNRVRNFFGNRADRLQGALGAQGNFQHANAARHQRFRHRYRVFQLFHYDNRDNRTGGEDCFCCCFQFFIRIFSRQI